MSIDPGTAAMIALLLAFPPAGAATASGAAALTGVRVAGGAAAKQAGRQLATRAATGGAGTAGAGTARGGSKALDAVDDLTAIVPGKWRAPLRGELSLARRFEKPPQNWNPGHRGVDLRTDASGVVLAANNGRVVFAGRVGGKNSISILHPGGIKTTYEPVIASVKKGDSVRSGQVIGRIGGPGGHCSPGTCLHWGALKLGEYIDPLTLLGGTIRLLPLQ